MLRAGATAGIDVDEMRIRIASAEDTRIFIGVLPSA
jgi:hypothetical protein